MEKFKRNPAFNAAWKQVVERIERAGVSLQQLGRRMGGSESSQRGWAARFYRWQSASKGAPPLDQVRAAVTTARFAEPGPTIAWLTGQSTTKPAWMRARNAYPFENATEAALAIATETVAVADPGAVHESLEQGRVMASVGGSGMVIRRAKLPPSIRAILADVRDAAISVEDAEKMLAAIFGVPNPSLWTRHARKAPELVLLR